MDTPRVCELCGVYPRELHHLTVTIDGRLFKRLAVCLEHREKLRDVIADAVSDLEAVAARD